ncbi:hypothetical protein HA402_002177 [Bradysia odoriphaga]|nr:hypothetical protein HA402_002177 [Bradysia odoriphaga]
MNSFSVVLSIILFINCCVIEGVRLPNELTHIDLMRENYLNVEANLWNVIKSGAENSYVLKQINDAHIKFFAEPLYEKEIHLTIYDPDQKILKLEIEDVNHRIATARRSHLRTNVNDMNRNQAVSFAANGITRKSSLDAIFNVTDEKDFFRYVRNKGDLESCMDSTTSRIDSTNQLIYEYYYDISAVLLKTYALLQLSYMFLTVYGHYDHTMHAQEVQFRFKSRSSKMRNHVRVLLADSRTDVWMCDPDVYYKLDNTDNQITRFVQGYMDNEANLNEKNSCRKTCSHYQLAQNYNCFNGTYCSHVGGEEQKKHRCLGTILNCTFIDSHVNVCPAEDASMRRYTNLKFDDGRTLGPNVCPNIARRSTSWNRWFVHCSNCFCYCDEQGPKSDRYFSLHPVLSDTHRNKIITGVAIQKVNRVFHWRITQKVLMGNGIVYETRNAFTTFREGSFFNIGDNTARPDVDYHTLTWQNRSVNLVSAIAPQGTVLTGVRFYVQNGRLSLAIRATKFDFATGQLEDVHLSEWITNTSENRTPITLDSPDVPNKSTTKSIPTFENNKYIEFRPTDIDKDAGQTTVPFIDDQIVEPRKPTLLSGVGLYYKGQPGFGGFIAPRVFTYDMGPYIRPGDE